MQSKVQNLDTIVTHLVHFPVFSPHGVGKLLWASDSQLSKKKKKKIPGALRFSLLKLNKSNVNEEVKVKGAGPTFH